MKAFFVVLVLLCSVVASSSNSMTEASFDAQTPIESLEDERIGLFFQPGQKAEHKKLIRELRRYAQQRSMTFTTLESEQLPEEITATPALVYQNGSGRTIYPGMHLDAEAMKLFVDGNRIALRPVELDFRRSVAIKKAGRATTVLVLKLTDWTTENESISQPDSTQWRQEVLAAITRETEFDRYGPAELWPTDRRYYLDIHAYRSASGQDYLTYAVFSQFNCHEPIFTSFNQPVGNLETLAREVSNRLIPYYSLSEKGFSPEPVSSLSASSWDELGWDDLAVGSNEATGETSTNSQPGRAWVAAAGKLSPRPQAPDLPMVQFNFPPPIDRYAGTIQNLEGEVQWSADGQSLSGEFQVELSKLTMGNEALDEYVIKDALRARRFKYANFRFAEVSLPDDWQTDQVYSVDIPAEMELMGINIPMPTQANLKATFDRAGNPVFEVSTLMQLDISQPFELVGPDGPEDIKNTVRIRTQFQLSR